MGHLPRLDTRLRANLSPHVVILGAGASRAATPNGDRHGQRLPLMADLADTAGLSPVLDAAGVGEDRADFEVLYEQLAASQNSASLLSKIESHITGFFERLEIPDSPTLYDYLLLALREKDLIATFNWDPLLVQAYQRNSHIKRLPQMVFLHGNVGIGACVKCRVKGYYGDVCAKCSKPFERTRLLYPVASKDYTSDPFIKAEWAILKAFLTDAYLLTVFGYRAPSSDAAAVDAMRSAWADNGARELAQIEIVDIRPEDDVVPSWKPFITSHHYGLVDSLFKTMMFFHPRRTCDAFAYASLQQRPWRDNPIPAGIATLDELHSWIAPLLTEEGQQENDRKPFSGSPCSELLRTSGTPLAT